MYKIGIDIGGTKINIGLFSENSLILNKKLLISEIKDLPQSILKCINELCLESKISFNEIVSCGVGIPGTVSEDGKKILKAPNISILNENIADEIGTLLDMPVTLVQDSRAAAWGEYLCGGGIGANSVVCVAIGTGIGTGIVIDGKIYNGALGCAGEIGHLPAKENGRSCGCGKKGCVEKYCAGGGLDITAMEILGEGNSAKELFEAASMGNEQAANAVSDAVKILGNALVSIVNLMSPDCILFSGGLSEQEKQYINPLIEYIQKHCYNAGRLPIIKKASLGENSPLYGAALIPCSEKRRPILSASIMCADILNMGAALTEIEDAGIEYIHCDIMDNHFVPNMMLPPELLNKLHNKSKLPFDFHIMAEKPESIIDKLNLKNGDIVSVHYESTVHLQRVITLIKEKGARAAVAINPSTPVCMIDEILSELDMVLIMSVNPGFAGQKIVPSSFGKIAKVKSLLRKRNLDNVLIEVDGNCSFENVPKMYKAGADIFVVGTSSVFKTDLSIKQGTEKLLKLI